MQLVYNKKGEPLSSVEEWSQLFSNPEYQVVKQENINDVKVSTVWLGIDHSWGDGPPMIFETMVFGSGKENELQERYATEEQALRGHSRWAEWVRAGMPGDDPYDQPDGRP